MSDARERHGKSSLQEEIIGIIKHDEVDALIQRFLAHARKAHKAKVIINAIVIFLGFSIGISTFYLAYKSNANQTLAATERAYDQEKALSIQTVIQQKIEWLKKIDAAIINMREVRYHIVLKCQYNQPINAYQQALLRDNARLVVINALTGSKFIFNDTVEKKGLELTAFDESVKDVCAKNAPHDIKWREYLIEIDNIMGQSIKEEQDKLSSLDLQENHHRFMATLSQSGEAAVMDN